jgi:hypothetical protein
MNRRVTFKTLWLVSERDRKARSQPFSPKQTLLLGTNGTGKSRIAKNLFWVFGCEPDKRVKGSWDPDSLAALDFSYNGSDYLVLRQGKRMGLFDGSDNLLFASENMAAWEAYIGPFFGYELQLQRPNAARFSQAGMAYLTLPFYLDQDGSWGADWDTFTNLGQFRNWKSATFEAFIGLRPNAYFKAKQLRDEVNGRLVDKRKELDAQRAAFTRVHQILPRNLPSLNTSAFRAELAELGRRALKTQQHQAAMRGKLLATVNLREKVEAELQLAVAAQRELVADLTYLSDMPEKAIECPTCGTRHENSFHARLQLSQDSDSMSALVAEFNKKLQDIREDEVKVRGELRTMEKNQVEFDALLQERRARLRLEDVLAAHSKKTLDSAFQRVTSELGASVRKLEEQEAVQAARLKKFEERERQKLVSKYFGDQVVSISNLLNVPSDEQIPKPRPSARAQAGGSSAPRSMLAVHLALLSTNAEYGDSPFFPFVVDTPQQSGQDDRNLRSMIEVLGPTAGRLHQVILAAEKLPDNVDTSGFQVVHFDTQKGALRAEDYSPAADRLRQPLRRLKEGIEARLARMGAAQEESPSPSD